MHLTTIRRAVALPVAGIAAAATIALGQPAGATPAAQAPGAAGDQRGHSPAGTVRQLHLDGVCNQYSNGDGDLCLWSTMAPFAEHLDFFYSDSDLTNNTYPSGLSVTTDTGQVFNYDLNLTARLCTGLSGTGTCGSVPPGSGGNLLPGTRLRSFSWI